MPPLTRSFRSGAAIGSEMVKIVDGAPFPQTHRRASIKKGRYVAELVESAGSRPRCRLSAPGRGAAGAKPRRHCDSKRTAGQLARNPAMSLTAEQPRALAVLTSAGLNGASQTLL